MLDVDVVQNRLEDLTYPDTLENVEELKNRISDGLIKAAQNSRIEPAVFDAMLAFARHK